MNVLFANDTMLLSESSDSLQRLVNVFNRACKKRKLIVNGGKSKVIRVRPREDQRELRISLGREEVMEQIESFVYLEVELSEEGGLKKELDHRLLEGKSALGGIWNVWRKGNMSMGMKRLFESMFILKVIYGSESWILCADDIHRLEVFDMKAFRNICGVSLRDKVRNV